MREQEKEEKSDGYGREMGNERILGMAVHVFGASSGKSKRQWEWECRVFFKNGVTL